MTQWKYEWPFHGLMMQQDLPSGKHESLFTNLLGSCPALQRLTSAAKGCQLHSILGRRATQLNNILSLRPTKPTGSTTTKGNDSSPSSAATASSSAETLWSFASLLQDPTFLGTTRHDAASVRTLFIYICIHI